MNQKIRKKVKKVENEIINELPYGITEEELENQIELGDEDDTN